MILKNIVRKHRDIKLFILQKTEILMNKPAYLGFSILELSEILMYELWYDYLKPKLFKTLLYEYR